MRIQLFEVHFWFIFSSEKLLFRSWHRNLPNRIFASIRLKVLPYASIYLKEFWRIKIPMGIEPTNLIPPVSKPFMPGYEWSDSESFFKSAENHSENRLWLGGHRYTRILCVSKLLWVYSHLKSDFFSDNNLLNSI